MKIKKAILVDDEPKAIQNLTILLNEYCKTIQIVGTANSVDEASILIEKHKPEVVFLDIEMPKKTGFQLLKETKNRFQVIFVTAYDEYAIKAFEVSAVDYLLKPIDIKRLIESVEKLNHIKSNNSGVLEENISYKTINKIVIPKILQDEILTVDKIVCFNADRTYTNIFYEKNGNIHKTIYSKPLRYFCDLLESSTLFFRSHRSWMINTNYLRTINQKELTLSLKGGIKALISRNKKSEAISLLKNILKD